MSEHKPPALTLKTPHATVDVTACDNWYVGSASKGVAVMVHTGDTTHVTVVYAVKTAGKTLAAAVRHLRSVMTAACVQAGADPTAVPITLGDWWGRRSRYITPSCYTCGAQRSGD